jgi:hypothetical protein
VRSDFVEEVSGSAIKMSPGTKFRYPGGLEGAVGNEAVEPALSESEG